MIEDENIDPTSGEKRRIGAVRISFNATSAGFVQGTSWARTFAGRPSRPAKHVCAGPIATTLRFRQRNWCKHAYAHPRPARSLLARRAAVLLPSPLSRLRFCPAPTTAQTHRAHHPTTFPSACPTQTPPSKSCLADFSTPSISGLGPSAREGTGADGLSSCADRYALIGVSTRGHPWLQIFSTSFLGIDDFPVADRAVDL